MQQDILKLFVPKHIAYTMKVLGYNYPSFGRYFKSSLVITEPYDHNCTVDFESAATWDQVKEWFRTVHNINLEIYQADSGNYVYSLTTTGANNQRLSQDGNFPYYLALEYGTTKALELCVNPNIIEICKPPKSDNEHFEENMCNFKEQVAATSFELTGNTEPHSDITQSETDKTPNGN